MSRLSLKVLIFSSHKLNLKFKWLKYLSKTTLGRLTVTLNNRRENNQFVKSFSGDIVEIISKANEKLWLPPGGSIFQICESNGQRYARTLLKGKCRFRLGVEQKVTLAEEKV